MESQKKLYVKDMELQVLLCAGTGKDMENQLEIRNFYTTIERLNMVINPRIEVIIEEVEGE